MICQVLPPFAVTVVPVPLASMEVSYAQWKVYLLHWAPVSSVVAALTSMNSFLWFFAWVATARAADEVGTSRMTSAPLRSYSSWALVLAISGLFWWSALVTSIFLATALSPYLAL